MLSESINLIVFTARRFLILATTIIFLFSTAKAQDFELLGQRKKNSISFKSIKSLIIVPLYINDKGPYDFLLDTGVGFLLITDASILDSLNYNSMRKMNIMGLGAENVNAYISKTIHVNVGGVASCNMSGAVLKEDLFNLSGHLGIKVYGVIGYNFFNSFVVGINYSNKKIHVTAPGTPVKYKGTKIPITIKNYKPFIKAEIKLAEEQRIHANFLMDTGAGHALSLERLGDKAFPMPTKTIPSNLGLSLSGQIKGYLGRTIELTIGNYTFKNIISSFPDYASITDKIERSRNGNVGAELLKRFDIQFNYREGFIYLKPNIYFKNAFEHDMVGMVVYFEDDDLNNLVIGEIDQNSPAEKAGLCVGDQIVSINFKSVKNLNLSDVDLLFKSKEKSTLVFEVFRENEYVYKLVRLERRI